MTLRSFLSILALAVFTMIPAIAADLTGKWTASFDTQIGVQKYTYDIKVDGEKLTGTAKSEHGESSLTNGTVKGDEVTFTETLKYQGMEITVTYKGKIAGDEIKFTRQVGDFASEDLVAKRAK